MVANASSLLENHPSLTTVFVHGPDHVFSVGLLPKLVSGISAKYPKLNVYRPSKAVDFEADVEYEKHTGKTR